MDVFDALLAQTPIPRFVPAGMDLQRGGIGRADVDRVASKSIWEIGVLSRLKPGERVAVAAGSRGINNYDRIVLSVIDTLRAAGAKPFIFPAMGSHGGATADGQLAILESYGITEKTMGVPIVSSMETVCLGETAHGLPVYIDKNAAGADWIVPIGRVKPHTEFHGRHESGLFKMMTIGCGKQRGADICHGRGYGEIERNIVEIAEVMMEKRSVLFGMAIVEDAFHGTFRLEAVPPERFEEEDAILLAQAKALVSRIPFPKIDVLILNEFGKNISGAGMDPNVTGRSGTVPIGPPYVERICVLDLTDGSHHNGAGIGVADVTTRRFFDKMSFEETYPNGITSHDLASLKIPPVLPNDKNAVRMAIHTISGERPQGGPRVVWMQNTLALDAFLISESLLPDAKNIPGLHIGQGKIQMEFDEAGNLLPAMQWHMTGGVCHFN